VGVDELGKDARADASIVVTRVTVPVPVSYRCLLMSVSISGGSALHPGQPEPVPRCNSEQMFQALL